MHLVLLHNCAAYLGYLVQIYAMVQTSKKLGKIFPALSVIIFKQMTLIS